MKSTDIEHIMRDFNVESESQSSGEKNKSVTLTIWIPAEDKARYDRIQKQSGRKFSKKVREVIQAVIDHVEKTA